MHRSRVHKKNKKIIFDKYQLYHDAVQSPDNDVEFLMKVSKELKKKKPKIFREDFCAAGALSAEWVKANKNHHAIGMDIDPEPMEYGRSHYLAKLKPEQQKRIKLIEKNVLGQQLPKADIVAALNFSYSVFKKREVMKEYFKKVFQSLHKDGLFVVDIFGGGQCQDEIEDVLKMKGFTYYWDQTGFDPVSNEAVFHIHFRVKGKKIEKVFTYDWRLWTIPELRELMAEVGFKRTHIYWEGTTRKGEGDGVFTRTEKGEACLSWVAYIVAEK